MRACPLACTARGAPGPNGDPDRERRGPGDELDAPLISDIEAAYGARVGRPVPPRDRQRRGDDRNHDRQHDGGRVDQQEPLGRCDRSWRVEHARGAAGGDEQRHADHRQSMQARMLEGKSHLNCP